MSDSENIDEITLRRLWGSEISRLTPGVKSIIVAALRKARERKESRVSLSANAKT